MEIKIRSIQFIKPSKSTPENLRNFKLSLLDQLAPSSIINIILYYKACHELNVSNRHTQLVKSLSEVLTLFYPLAGRITEDGLAVNCSDQGVKYLETQVPIKFDDFLEQGPKTDLVNQLVDHSDEVNSALVTFQVNAFDCGALAIGVSASHKVTDACNLVRFVNEWASTMRKRGSFGEFSPSFDNLDAIFPPKEMEISSSKVSKHTPIFNNPEASLLVKKFVFNATSISNLRAKTSSLNRKHSRVTLVASLIWKTLISIDHVKSGSLRDCLLAPAMNLRGKVGSPVSGNSFGNVWAPYPIRYLHEEMKLDYADLVTLIDDTTRNTVKKLLEASNEEICTQVMTYYGEAYKEIKINKFCVFSSWCGFPLYEVDFGWGKPYWVSEAGASLQKVILMDDKDGEGIEAWVTLNEKDMYVFGRDQEILAFTS